MWKLAFALVLLGAVAAPVTAEEGDATITLEVIAKTDDRVEVSARPDRVLLDIKSPRGIGTATIRRVAGEWPPTVVLRLRLKGLESLTVSNGARTLEASVSSHGEHEQRLSLEEGGRQERVEKGSPYWTSVKLVGGRKIPLDEGYFELALPAGFVKRDARALTLRWIDFFR